MLDSLNLLPAHTGPGQGEASIGFQSRLPRLLGAMNYVLSASWA